MCGIHVSISTQNFLHPSQQLEALLCKRGPDHIGHGEIILHSEGERPTWISLTSTVLALRGGHITHQPFIDASTQSALCWNGEAWKIEQRAVNGNDGQAVFDSLLRACSAHTTSSEATSATLNLLRSVSGPFAFVFIDKIHSQIYFGRDCLGRRSLLFKSQGDFLQLASTSDPAAGGWNEVEADGIYQLSLRDDLFSIKTENLKDLSLQSLSPIIRHSWELEDSSQRSLGFFNKSIPSEPCVLRAKSPSINALRRELSESLQQRILNVPEPSATGKAQDVRIAILFSGGLDCTVLARMADDILPPDHQVDLINVAFENPRVIQAAKNAAKSQNSKVAAAEVQVDGMLQPRGSSQDIVMPINQSPYESCPDRQTGRKAFQELQTVCPARVWRFVAVDVPYEETVAHRPNVISLIYPHNTEMDLSIAYALYFAARGVGKASSNQQEELGLYTTPARVLLSGLGADELFGGYTRHATAFSRHGYKGLLDELELDVNRLGKRNLGRDDRVISHWGREARFPYLDESLVKWAVECPIWDKCGFLQDGLDHVEEPDIEPGKKVLRLLAYELGMHSVAREKKRAIQFGARTAKMEVGRTKGTALIS